MRWEGFGLAVVSLDPTSSRHPIKMASKPPKMAKYGRPPVSGSWPDGVDPVDSAAATLAAVGGAVVAVTG